MIQIIYNMMDAINAKLNVNLNVRDAKKEYALNVKRLVGCLTLLLVNV